MESKFRDNEDLQGATEAWLGGRDKEFFKSRLVSVKDKWNKCIEVKVTILKNKIHV